MAIMDALDYLVDALKSKDIAATLDPREINPPGAWIAARRAEDFSLSNSPTMVVADVYLITRDAGIIPAIESLDNLLGAALFALAVANIGVTSVSLDESVTIPSGGGPLPSYRLTVQVLGEF